MHYNIYDLDEQSQIFGNINMLIAFGCLLGATMGGSLSDIIGRKSLSILILFLKVLVLILYCIYSIPVLYVVRVIDGLTIGAIDGFITNYVSEITPSRYRGFAG
jgi:MFS family permease